MRNALRSWTLCRGLGGDEGVKRRSSSRAAPPHQSSTTATCAPIPARNLVWAAVVPSSYSLMATTTRRRLKVAGTWPSVMSTYR